MRYWEALREEVLQPDTWPHRLAAALLVLLLALLIYLVVGGLLGRVRGRLLRRVEGEGATTTAVRARSIATGMLLATAVLRWAVILLAALYVLSALGVNLWPVLTGVGFVGAAIAFGAQSLVRDLVTGLFLLLEGQYAVGEYVALNGVFGRVAEVSFRTTALELPDGRRQYFPHGSISSVAVYREPRAGLELHVPLAGREQAEALAPELATLTAQVQATHAAFLLEAEAPEAYGEGPAAGLRQRLAVLPGQEWVVNEELVGRVKALLEQREITLPAGLAPTARPLSPAA